MDIATKERPYHSCAICNDKTAFQNVDKTLNTDNYKEIAYRVSNGSIMTVGFCNVCHVKHKEDVQIFEHVMESVKDGWLKEMELEKWKPEIKLRYIANFFNLKIESIFKGAEVGA